MKELIRRRTQLQADVKAIETESYDSGSPGEIDGAMIAVRLSEIAEINILLKKACHE